ncbi:transcriptional regulator [Lysinibacillus sp. FJAT-14745]|uniref:helix-turn-helix domain-containing protein n=1 Tax=Lysinibacillus sp. FJAT-14745 TaxID=1704289 RepID=UPI0006ABCB74|nr:helix-turn-helix transcriptional regulator [Lysinibacillus sp. FJAT-14745]KOP72399.1 transcriptional regulator [Lysinibacillus sp. FJAT-14745]
MLTATEKLKVILKRKNMTVKELADLLGTSRQNLHGKLSKDNLSENDLKKFCEVLDVKYEINFILENGDKI